MLKCPYGFRRLVSIFLREKIHHGMDPLGQRVSNHRNDLLVRIKVYRSGGGNGPIHG